MAYNKRSRTIVEGVERSPNRAMFYALGYTKDDFDKPMIGVANGHSTITPCNGGLQVLAEAACLAIKEAGGNPQLFGVPTISDGMSMGTEGMKYSLVSREVIADCIEMTVQGQWMDGVLVIGGCDKNKPGGMIGIARANVPAIYVYGGTIKPGKWKGQDLSVISSFEAVGPIKAGRMSQEDFDGIERNACPTTGACGGMYTANTMSSSFEAPGMPEMLAPTSAIIGRGLGDKVGLITDGRFSGGSWGMLVGHITPEAYEGGLIALVEEGDTITISAERALLQLEVDEAEIERRRKNWRQPKPRYVNGVLSKFAQLARPASEGAVTG